MVVGGAVAEGGEGVGDRQRGAVAAAQGVAQGDRVAVAGGEGDGGPALAASMNGPKHLCIDRDDTVIIADAENNLVRRYVPATGKIERVAGTGKQGSEGVGGSPLACQVARPHGVTIHPLTGELYITDSYNNRVLKIVK